MSANNKLKSVFECKALVQAINAFVKAYVSGQDARNEANLLVNEIKLTGLHYGHSVKARRGNQPVHKQVTRTIDLDVFKSESIVDSLFSWVALISKMLDSKQLIMIISKQSFGCSNLFGALNIVNVKRWMPGTITNSHFVLPSYNKKYGIPVSRRPSFIISTVVKLHGLLAAETENTNINVLSVVDSNVFVHPQQNVFPFFMNDESPYFPIFIDTFLSAVISRTPKKQ